MHEVLFWLILTLICVGLQGIFSMLEMAYVSFNRVKLHYLVSRKKRRAVWVYNLLQEPARLFGTTLIGVNIALQVGSECSRKLYEALNLGADLAPLTQGFLVLIFAELAPMTAARKYSETVALLGSPILYVASILLSPVIFLIRLLNTGITKLCRGKESDKKLFLTRDELRTAFEFPESSRLSSSGQFSDLIANVFECKSWTAQDIMTPVHLVPKLPSHASVRQMRLRLAQNPIDFMPIFFQTQHHIVGIAFAKDLVHVSNPNRRARDYARPPWFILQSTTILQILQQFKKNNHDVAIVLNDRGKAVGILSLDDILERIFHSPRSNQQPTRGLKIPFIQKNFSADTRVQRINRKYKTNLDAKSPKETLAQYMARRLGHKPEKGDIVIDGSIELQVVDSSLLGVKRIRFRSLL